MTIIFCLIRTLDKANKFGRSAGVRLNEVLLYFVLISICKVEKWKQRRKDRIILLFLIICPVQKLIDTKNCFTKIRQGLARSLVESSF